MMSPASPAPTPRHPRLWLAISLLLPVLTFIGSVSLLPWKLALLAQTAAIALAFGLNLAAQRGLLPQLDSGALRLMTWLQQREDLRRRARTPLP